MSTHKKHRSKPKVNKGFSLFELLIATSMISVLGVVGVIVYRETGVNVRDAKRRADINTLAKVYESKYNNSFYQPLQATDIMGGIPKPPEGGNYTGLVSETSPAFRVCTALENHPTRSCDTPSPTCYCLTSVQGDYASITQTPTPTSTPTPTPTGPTPTPTSGPPTPTPTPEYTPCTLGSASWGQISANVGQAVTLSATSSGDCNSYEVSFEVRRNGTLFDDIPADIQPAPQTFTPGSSSVSTAWVAEYNPLFPGTDPEYYFRATLMYGNTVEGNPKLLTVTQSSCNLQDLSSGLAGYFKLNENSGTQTYDSSGNNISADFINNPTWTTGKLGPALNFNGSAYPVYARVNYNSTLDNVTSGSFTFSAWIKPDSTPPTPPAGTNVATAVGKMGYPIFLGYDNQQRIVMNIYTTPWPFDSYTVYSQNSFTPGSWYYVTGVVDTNDSSVKVYVNGILEGSINYSGSLMSNSGYYYTIGASDSSSNPCNIGWSYCFSGAIDEVRIYNRALPNSEINAAYNNGNGCDLP